MRSALELAGIATGLTLTIAMIGAQPAWLRHLGAIQALVAVAFGFFALVVLQVRRFEALPHPGLVVFGVALALRLSLLLTAPALSGDVYRYVWEGRVLVAGGNPWRQSPDDPALAGLRDRLVWPNVNHRDLATIYPPLAEAGFALVARVSSTVTAFKSWVLLHDLALVLILMRWMSRLGRSPLWAIAYAWNPLVLVEYAGSGHNDPTAMMWLALALMLASARPAWSAAALSVGALVKLAPLLALPFLWRAWTPRARLLCLLILGLGLGAFAVLTRTPGSGLTAYWSTWRNNEFLFDLLERWTGSYAAARAAGLAVVAGVLAFAWWKRRESAAATRLGLQTALLTSPVLHPWYLGWTLLFEPLAPSWPWLLLSLTVLLNYGVFAPPAAGANFHLPPVWRGVEYGLPILLALVLISHAHRRARAEARE
jgi:alpha-1,6-mannosyltransferase